MSVPVHRDTDLRICGATTTVVGQGTVYANGLLIAVDQDPNTHGNGQLIADPNAVSINGKLVVNHTPENAQPDDLCIVIGPPHCNPFTDQGSPDVFVGDPGATSSADIIAAAEAARANTEDFSGLPPGERPGEEANGAPLDGSGPSAQEEANNADVDLSGADTSAGMTPERAEAIRELAERYGASPEAIAGILDIESGLDPNIQGGAGNNFYGIFQLQGQQIPGLTEQALGQRLSIAEYRQLGFNDQLRVYEQYWNNAGVREGGGFFTGNAAGDASRLWNLQLAPSRALRTDYSNPNAVISATNKAAAISARPGLVTVGSVQQATINRGGLD